MRIRILLIVVLFWGITSCEAQDIDTCECYIQALKEINSSKEAPIRISFDFELSPGLWEILEGSEVFSLEELDKVKEGLSKGSFRIEAPCKDKLEEIVQVNYQESDSSVNTYKSVNLSELIPVSEHKAYLFLEILDFREGTVAGGGSVLEEYVLTDGAWSLTSKRILEMN